MDYQGAVRYLLSLGRELAAPTQASATKFNLQNIHSLLERLGRPDRTFPSVHIAGTNGKGSTAAFVESILRHAGFRTGLNTSPHLERINERIRIGGEPVSDDLFAETATRVVATIEELLAEGKLRAHPTYFECVTAIAFEVFARERVEFAVVEVGLGGRLDATNVLSPVVSVITRIDFDHENFLGHSLREIAAEKAGILKRGTAAVIGYQPEEAHAVLISRATELHCPILDTREDLEIISSVVEQGSVQARIRDKRTDQEFDVSPRLMGAFQLENVLTAIETALVLQSNGYRIEHADIVAGIASANWPGRIERVQTRPDVYFDGAHNPGSARALAEFLRSNFPGRRIFLLFAAMRDKAVDEIAGILFPLAEEVIFTEANNPRAVSASQLQEIAAHHARNSSVEPNAEKALTSLLQKVNPEDVIFITGSLYLVGQLKPFFHDRGRVASAREST